MYCNIVKVSPWGVWNFTRPNINHLDEHCQLSHQWIQLHPQSWFPSFPKLPTEQSWDIPFLCLLKMQYHTCPVVTRDIFEFFWHRMLAHCGLCSIWNSIFFHKNIFHPSKLCQVLKMTNNFKPVSLLNFNLTRHKQQRWWEKQEGLFLRK